MTVLNASPCARTTRSDRVAAREDFIPAKMEDVMESDNFSSSSLSTSSEEGEHPDGRWSWVIVFASFMAQAVSVGMAFSFGVYYVEFLEQFEGTRGQLAWVGALCTGALFATGPLSSVLANKFGFRRVVMAGACLSALGYIITSLVEDIFSLLFSSGLLVGVGYGLVYTPSVAIVGSYFNKRRTLATGIAVSGCGFGSLTFAPLFQYLIESFGWRGSMLINAGITLNVVCLGALMRPLNSRYRGSLISTDLFNTSLLKNATFWTYLINNVLFNVGSLILFVLLPDFCSELGISPRESTWLLSLIGVMNTAGRLVAAIMGNFGQAHHLPFFVYTFSCGLTGVIVCLFALYQSYAAFVIYSGAYGLCFGVQLGFLAALTAELFGVARLTSAYGYLMFANGAGALMGPPIAGLLFDVTKTYDAGFYFGGAVTVLAAALMGLVPYLNSRRKRDGKMDDGGGGGVAEKGEMYGSGKLASSNSSSSGSGSSGSHGGSGCSIEEKLEYLKPFLAEKNLMYDNQNNIKLEG